MYNILFLKEPIELVEMLNFSNFYIVYVMTDLMITIS